MRQQLFWLKNYQKKAKISQFSSYAEFWNCILLSTVEFEKILLLWQSSTVQSVSWLDKLDIGFIGFPALYQSSFFLRSKVELEGEEKKSKEKVETMILALQRDFYLEKEGGSLRVGPRWKLETREREHGMNGGLWMMKNGGRDLEGRSWRKGVGESSRGEFEEAGARIWRGRSLREGARRKNLDGWSYPAGGCCTEVWAGGRDFEGAGWKRKEWVG